MKLQRIAWLSIGVAVLAAMIAGATTSSGRRMAPEPPPLNTAAIELQGAELAAEVVRLRARLRPSDEPQQPARNLFRFAGRAARSAAADDLPLEFSAPAVTTSSVPTPPPFTVIGFAVESTADRPVRTAIISAFGDVFLVKDGDTLAAQYEVVRVGVDAVELISLQDGTPLTLRVPD